MIKIKVVVILMVAIMGITAVPIQASEKQGDSKKQENKATQVISDEEQELLKKEDIQVVSDENGNIKLKNTSPLKNYSVYSSKKFKKATKNAFASAMTSWLTTKIPSPQIIVGAAVSAYVTYYFVNSDECNVYFRYLYYYRIVGPTKFDKNGNAIPQYELKRKMTTSKNKKFTSGQNKTQTKKSSILTW